MVEGTLLSLLIGFTFSLAAGKYDKRRSTFTDEINTISTTIYRSHLYPDSIANKFTLLLKPYLENRISYYQVGSSQLRIDSVLRQGQLIAGQLFEVAAVQSRNPANLASSQQMVPALNDMFDAVTTREIFRLSKVPISVIRLLLVLSFVVSILNGYNQDREHPNWVSAWGYTLLISLSFALILDYGSNRGGKINLDNEQKALIALRQQF